MLVACRVAPLDVERVLVRSFSPRNADEGNGLASQAPFRPFAGVEPSLKQSSVVSAVHGCVPVGLPSCVL